MNVDALIVNASKKFKLSDSLTPVQKGIIELIAAVLPTGYGKRRTYCLFFRRCYLMKYACLCL